MNTEQHQPDSHAPVDSTEERQFHPYRLLMVIVAVSAVLALISYGLQVYFLPDYF